MKKLEENLLGTILLFPQEFVLSADKLKVEYFYHFETKCVYNAMCELLKGGFNIDTVTVCLELKKRGQLDQIGGPYYITSLTNEIGNLNFLINRLVEVYLIRELSFLGLQIQKKTADTVNDPLEIIEDINNKISDITTFKLDKVKTLKTIYGDLVKDIYEVISSGQPTGILSGLNDLDSITGGWQNGNLIIIAARPAMGKTAVALHLAKIPALNNIPVAFFSLEMTASELAGRLASSESYIPSTLINQKRIGLNDIEVMNTSFNKLSDAPFYIDDSSVLSISDLKAKAKKLKYERNIKLIIVDYLQLMRGEGEGSREQEISSISRGLKTIAKDLNIPVIALSQLSRKCEERPDKRPLLSDLRESGSIEQDADIVSFIFRPEYYELFPNGYEYKGKPIDTRGLMLFDIAKGRGLQTGEVALKFDGKIMRINNI